MRRPRRAAHPIACTQVAHPAPYSAGPPAHYVSFAPGGALVLQTAALEPGAVYATLAPDDAAAAAAWGQQAPRGSGPIVLVAAGTGPAAAWTHPPALPQAALAQYAAAPQALLPLPAQHAEMLAAPAWGSEPRPPAPPF
jgi:hypothetical protein